MILYTTIAGIPCRVLLSYHAPLSGSLLEPPVPEHFEIEEVQDEHGRPAKWLDAKMTKEDERRIYDMADDALTGDRKFKY